TGTDIAIASPGVAGESIGGDSIGMRALVMPGFGATNATPALVYVQLAQLLGGTPYAGPATTRRERIAPEPPVAAPSADFALLQLEPLVDADPFTGPRAPLDDPELAQVYPIEHHLF